MRVRAARRPRHPMHPVARMRRARASEAGFTMIELAVSVAIFGLVMAVLTGMMAVGMRGVLRGKQREVAVQDNGELLEIARSLSYDNLGLAQNDPTLATDPAIVTQGGVKKYLVDAQTSLYEPIVWAVNATNHPFNPHVAAVQRGSTKLNRYVYVTGVDANGDGTIDYKRVTSRVSWDPQGSGSTASSEVRAQTFIAESALTPVGGPGSAGNAPLSAKSLSRAGSGSVRVDRATGPSDSATALPMTPVTFALPSTDASTRSHAITGIDCRAQGPSVTGATTTYGGKAVAVAADDDPTTATQQQPAPQTLAGFDAITSGDDVDSVVVEPGLTYALMCGATASDSDGQPPADDQLPYEAGTASGPGTLTFSQDITGTGLGTGVLNVMKVNAPTAVQSIDHSSSGVREIASLASGTIGETQLQQATGVIPRGVVRLQSFSYSAVARASSQPPGAPSISVPSGIFVEIYDVFNSIPASMCDSRSIDGYCQKTVHPAAPGFTGWAAGVDQEQSFNLGLTKVRFKGTVDFLPPAVSPAAGTPGPNGETLWTASYTALSVSAQVSISIDLDGLPGGATYTLTDSIVDVTLGNVSTTGCHGVACQ